MAVSEAPDNCDVSKKSVWQTMSFNVYDMGNKEAVRHAYDILREGGTVIDPLGSCDWNAYCSNLIDKFGVFWWILFNRWFYSGKADEQKNKASSLLDAKGADHPLHRVYHAILKCFQ